MPAIADPNTHKRKLRSYAPPRAESPSPSPPKWKSPRPSAIASPHSAANGNEIVADENQGVLRKPDLVKSLWNLKDGEQLRVVKEALHLATAPSAVVCREEEQDMVLGFCKSCIEHEKAGSLYICGCPGTGKSLSMEKVKEALLNWAKEGGFPLPDVLSVNCTSLANTSDIFTKILGLSPSRGRRVLATPLQQLQNMYSQKSSTRNMMLIVADELDYLITRDRAVLHDLFMLTTFPFARCILIGVANAIDLADRFLPRLTSLNCKPTVVTFRAYSKDQILRILEERLNELPYTVFQRQALELCARVSPFVNVSASLHLLLSCNAFILNLFLLQIILCSSMKHFCGSKKDTILGELYKSYSELCKSSLIPPTGILEFSNMCRVLNDQGLIKLGPSREDKLKRVTPKVDEADITFALQGIRFFRNCLQ
ncbi:cell division control protein 6 homolog B [Arachis ipaensis]|uniref:cell division control protein 6 homolog B n=1 Tax=Arachis ipaensis TaxID=130454 RepID=UPI000A2B4AEB|nr:cell division control protein 6 homolog B [Arachis ipaensis]